MLSIIIPAYNEEKAIEARINQVNNLSIEKEIIVVNDCSKDRTAAILSSFALNNLKVIHHISNRGKLAAVHTGIENAVGEFVIVQDVHAEYGLSDYLKLLEVIKQPEVDMVLGSYFTKTRFSNFFLNIIFGIKLNNWFSHCQLVRRESLLKILPELKSANFAFDILTKAIRKKMRVMEVHI